MSSESENALTALGTAIQEYQATVDDFDRETARVLGVNRTDQRCLEILVEGDGAGLTPREIADRLALTSGSVTTMLDRLERAGYVSRSQHPRDGRRLIVTVTPVALERIWELIGPHLSDSTAAVLSDFAPDELDAVQRFLLTVTGIQREHVSRLREREPWGASDGSGGDAA